MSHKRNEFTETPYKEILLSQGKVALVDNDDYERVNKFNWYAHKQKNKSGDTFYATRNIRVEYKRYQMAQRMARFILNISDKKIEVDHINHDTLDNRKSNLRVVTHRQNMQNAVRNKTSKFVGVDWVKAKKRWRSMIQINGLRIHLGLFETEDTAHAAYIAAQLQYNIVPLEVIDNGSQA